MWRTPKPQWRRHQSHTSCCQSDWCHSATFWHPFPEYPLITRQKGHLRGRSVKTTETTMMVLGARSLACGSSSSSDNDNTTNPGFPPKQTPVQRRGQWARILARGTAWMRCCSAMPILAGLIVAARPPAWGCTRRRTVVRRGLSRAQTRQAFWRRTVSTVSSAMATGCMSRASAPRGATVWSELTREHLGLRPCPHSGASSLGASSASRGVGPGATPGACTVAAGHRALKD